MMTRPWYLFTLRPTTGGLALLLLLSVALCPLPPARAAELSEELKSVPYRIVYETWHDDNWELFIASADGSKQENLTRTPHINELYPHVSPDGTKVCFVCDEGEGASKIRNVYYMNMDGSGRTLVARNARQPCWKSDSTAIAYLKGELETFSYTDFATKGIFIYDLSTGRHAQHPNKDIYHLYNLCWSPDGKWFFATVHAGMGYRHTILAIEANGMKVFDLKIPGCRPDVSPDGKKIAWGPSDWALRVGDLDFTGPQPKVIHARDVVTSPEPMKVYHIDWSPDGRYVAYSRGPEKKQLGLIPEMVGVRAQGWDIYVADPTTTNRVLQITHDGNCNKEPDWAPVKEPAR
jgi:Tol biopolymer transport system component